MVCLIQATNPIFVAYALALALMHCNTSRKILGKGIWKKVGEGDIDLGLGDVFSHLALLSLLNNLLLLAVVIVFALDDERRD